jgi:hypothetical protein
MYLYKQLFTYILSSLANNLPKQVGTASSNKITLIFNF